MSKTFRASTVKVLLVVLNPLPMKTVLVAKDGLTGAKC